MNKPASPNEVVPPRREPILPNAVMGMLMFVIVEVMTFSGFISAFVIAKAQYTVWPPPNQPRLPVEATAFNSIALIASGILLFVAGRKFANSQKSAGLWMLLSVLLGSFFVVFQGYLGQVCAVISSGIGEKPDLQGLKLISCGAR